MTSKATVRGCLGAEAGEPYYYGRHEYACRGSSRYGRLACKISQLDGWSHTSSVHDTLQFL